MSVDERIRQLVGGVSQIASFHADHGADPYEISQALMLTVGLALSSLDSTDIGAWAEATKATLPEFIDALTRTSQEPTVPTSDKVH